MITRAFGANERPFCLKVAQWRDLEKARDCGLGPIAARLAPLVALKSGRDKNVSVMSLIMAGRLGDARLDDVRETIFQGLIGGGMSSTEAGILVRKTFDESADAGKSPMFDWADLAFEIVVNALVGLGDENKPGETKAAAQKKPRVRRSKTKKPASSSSTALSA